MSTPSTSNQWYRVAGLHPRLRGHVTVQRQIYREEVWYLLADGLRGRTHRINRSAYAFIGRCDGERTVNSVWESSLEHAPDDAPTQDEIILLLVQLNQRSLLQCEQTPDVEQLFKNQARERRQNRAQAMNPLAFRVTLLNPTNLLKRFDPVTPWLFNRMALFVWSLIVAAGLLTAAINWPVLQNHAASYMTTSQGIFLVWLCFPIIKAIHELAHGLAVRHWGGEVRQAGMTLMILTPIPFVDASAATLFRETHKRFMVSAAGIVVELGLAALAVLLWVQTQPGLLHDIALIVATIGCVSSLAVNGNPLLRFDGYYMLTDAIHLPNLQARSSFYWRYLLMRHALRLRDAVEPDTAQGEKLWLIAYTPLSWAYRIALSILITAWIGNWSAITGIIFGMACLWSLLLSPLHNFLQSLRRGNPSRARQRRITLTLSAWACAWVIVLGVIPMPFATLAQGIVWVPENAQLRAATAGFIEAFKVSDGHRVAPGEIIATLSDPSLFAESERIQAEIVQRETELYRLLLKDPVSAANLSEHIERLAAEAKRINERIEQLNIRAEVGGRLSIPKQQDLTGTYLPQGKLIGHIITTEAASIRVAVDQNSADRVRSSTQGISVRLAEAPHHPLPAILKNTSPAAANQLPSAALADRSGGPYVVAQEDKNSLKTREPLFLFDLILPSTFKEQVGGRAWVRFEHPAKPLATQWLEQLQQYFLKTFAPGS